MTTATQGAENADAVAAAATAAAATLTPEQIAQQTEDDDAAFADGYKAGSGEEPAPEAAAQDQNGAAAQAPAATGDEAAPAQAEVVEKPVLAGYTESQIKAMFGAVGELREQSGKTDKQLRQVFGKFGDIQAQLTAANTGLSKREINAESFKRLKADYPDLAESISADMAEVLAGTPAQGPGITQEQIDAHVNQAVAAGVAKAREEMTVEMLTRAHSDWANYIDGGPGKADIDLWLNTQSADYRNKFLDSHSASFIADGLDKFKDWKKQSQTARQKNLSRLEAAIPARGGAPAGSNVTSDDAAFGEGFMSVRGGKP